jgi:hypothetical protein
VDTKLWVYGEKDFKSLESVGPLERKLWAYRKSLECYGRKAHLGTLGLWNTGSMEGKLRKAYLGTLGLQVLP